MGAAVPAGRSNADTEFQDSKSSVQQRGATGDENGRNHHGNHHHHHHHHSYHHDADARIRHGQETAMTPRQSRPKGFTEPACMLSPAYGSMDRGHGTQAKPLGSIRRRRLFFFFPRSNGHAGQEGVFRVVSEIRHRMDGVARASRTHPHTRLQHARHLGR